MTDAIVDSIMNKLKIDPQHRDKIGKIQGYMEQNNIQELFNEMLVNVLMEQPENVKDFIREQLQKVEKKQIGEGQSEFIWNFKKDLLDKQDYEALFNTYDIMDLKHISVNYLIDALTAVGVPNAQQLVEEKYKDSVDDGHVNKVTFLYVLEEEHKLHGYSNLV